MTVAYNQITYPLTANAASANTGLVGCYDWAHDNGASGNSLSTPWTVSGNGTPPVVTYNSTLKGRDCSNGRTAHNLYYTAATLSSIGLGVGAGDFSISIRFRAPSVAGATTQLHDLARFTDAGGDKINIRAYELAPATGDGLYHFQCATAGGGSIAWNDTGNPGMSPGTEHTIGLSRTGTTIKWFIDGVLIKTQTSISFSLLTTSGTSVMGPFAINADWLLVHSRHSNTLLSDADMSVSAKNPYSLYTNSAPADGITVTSPTSGGLSGVNIAISGTYVGSDDPTTIEASFNGGAYGDVAVSPSGGTFNGTLTGQASGTGTLAVRWKNIPAVSTTVSGLTVTTDNVTFTIPDATACVIPNRGFQRNVATNLASVRVAGTYSGSPGSLQWQFAGGAWNTLVASPTGNAFDTTINLPVGSGYFIVRFSSNNAIIATCQKVVVGDGIMFLGQSQNVGKATTFIEAVAPSYHPNWLPVEFDKSNTWVPAHEAVGSEFSKEYASPYATYNAGGLPAGSYFGELARLMQATNVPVFAVPCAVGSTSLASWGVSTALNTYYGISVDRANKLGATGHRFVFWWQGENEANDSSLNEAQYASGLNAIINDWVSRYPGVKWILCNINNIKDGGAAWPNFAPIHAGIADVAAGNTNVIGIADMNGAWSSPNTHFGQGGGAEVTTVATRAFNALNMAVYASVGSALSTQNNNVSGFAGSVGIAAIGASTQKSTTTIESGSVLVNGVASSIQAVSFGLISASSIINGVGGSVLSANLSALVGLLAPAPSSGVIVDIQAVNLSTFAGSLGNAPSSGVVISNQSANVSSLIGSLINGPLIGLIVGVQSPATSAVNGLVQQPSVPLVPNVHMTYRGQSKFYKRTGETVIFTVDFADDLGVGEVINTAVWSCTVTEGQDQSVSNVINGSASMNGSQVNTKLSNGIAGVSYAPICTISTSLGQVLILPEYGYGSLSVTP